MGATSLGMQDRRRLVDAFLRLRCMMPQHSRERCVRLLEELLGRRLNLAEFPEPRLAVWELVGTCLDLPGGVHTLLDAVELLYPGSSPLRHLRELVAELLAEPLLDTDLRVELYQLAHVLQQRLGPFEMASLPLLYQHAVGPTGPPLRLEVPEGRDATVHSIDLRYIVQQLEEVPLGTDGTPPLLVFVQNLAGYAKGETATAFEQWMVKFCERSGLAPERLGRLPRMRRPALPGAGSAEEDDHLVIECRPDGADPDRYQVTAWLQPAGRPAVMLRCDEEPVPWEGLRAFVESLLTRDDRVWVRENPRLVVEFIVPRDLLDRPFDQFKLKIRRVARRLGVEYPVVLRSLDRLRGGVPWHNWQAKSRRLREEPEGAEVHRIREPGGYDDERLYTLLSESSTVGLAVGFPPREDGPDRVDELWVGLEAGLPVILWCRDGAASARFCEEVAALDGCDLPSLPAKVWELRRRAVLSRADEREAELGLHLALLFDDADRYPDIYEPLRAPA